MRAWTFFVGSALSSVALISGLQAVDEPVRVRGFVSRIESPTLLVIDDYRITTDRTYRARFDASSPSVCVGAEIEAAGIVDPVTGDLQVRTFTVKDDPLGRVRLTAVVSEAPRAGLLKADGRRLRIGLDTQVSFTKWGDAPETLGEVRAGISVSYEASRRDRDGAVLADRVEFHRNDTSGAEHTFLKDLKIEVREPDFERNRPGGVRFQRRNYFEIIPNLEIQRYITDLGMRLVPAYQRAARDNDPAKIRFRFYVVKDHAGGAAALPDGTVMVYSHLFDLLENEAQLAAVMGHEIAHVTEKHAWVLSNKLDPIFGNRYSREFEDQADRLGLEAMVAAGYDPSEAPEVWKIMSRKLGFVQTNAKQGTHDNHALRREYLMRELEQTYCGLDYASLTTEPDRFTRMARLVKGATDPTWKAKHDR
jgi:hypothetical protein